jgi:hypothetical protein
MSSLLDTAKSGQCLCVPVPDVIENKRKYAFSYTYAYKHSARVDVDEGSVTSPVQSLRDAHSAWTPAKSVSRAPMSEITTRPTQRPIELRQYRPGS